MNAPLIKDTTHPLPAPYHTDRQTDRQTDEDKQTLRSVRKPRHPVPSVVTDRVRPVHYRRKREARATAVDKTTLPPPPRTEDRPSCGQSSDLSVSGIDIDIDIDNPLFLQHLGFALHPELRAASRHRHTQ